MTTWPIVALGEVAHFVRGVTFKPSDVGVGAETVPVMRTKNVQALLDQDDVIRIPKRLVRRPDQFLRVGDTLISSANSWNLVGKCCWVPDLSEQTAIGGFVVSLRPNPKLVYPRFLYHWFASPRIQAEVRGMANSTTNISNLPIGRCEGLPLHLPPIEEQRRIAAILDHANSLRLKREQTMDLLRSIEEAAVERVVSFGRGTVQLGLIAEVRTGPFGSLLHKEDYVDNGVPLINPMHISDGQIVPNPKFTVSPDKASSLDRYRLRVRDVVMGRRGEMGRCAVVGPDEAGFLCGTGSLIVRPVEDRVRPTFLKMLLSSRAVVQALEARALGVTLPNLNTKIVESLPVPDVDMTRQARLETLLIDIGRARSLRAEAQMRLDALFTSLQARAFSGRL